MDVPKRLKAKNDGRKKAWWIKKIEKLEARIAELEGQSHTVTNGVAAQEVIVDDAEWSDGFIACMHQFQILSKAARQQIHRELTANGRGYARRLKGAKFRGLSL